MQSVTCISRRGDLVIIPVQAKPNARTSQITEINSEWIGVSIAAPPHDGEANKALCEFIASLIPGVKKRQVSVRPGTQKSRSKLVQVETDLQIEQIIEAIRHAR